MHSPPHTANHAAKLLAPAVLTLFLMACGGGGGGGSSPAPAPVNTAPVAEAGDSRTVDAGAAVILNGDASRDNDGSITAFAWSQIEGPAVELATPDQAQATFTAPSLGEDRELLFSLRVTDDDGATASDTVTITVLAATVAEQVSISGRILPSASQSLDGDTNDPFNPLLSNDDPAQPQRITNPTTLGGYVNEPGAGAEGRSLIAGDREDYFLVELLGGQSINLLVAEYQDADADLYLYSSAGELLDFSIETGPRETLVIDESGTYLVNVSIFAGATNYTLAIGSSLVPVSRPPYEDVIPGQVILSYGEDGEAGESNPNPENIAESLSQRLQMRQLGGGPQRARLMAMESAGQDRQLMTRRLGAQQFRRPQFQDETLAKRWGTLLSIKRLARTPGVASAEPNYRVRPTASVNDEAYPLQWHYPLISVPGAWESTTGNADVIVAVVDTGVLSGHPDLAGQLVPGYDFIRDASEAADGDGIDPNPEETIGGGDPAAINYHGTHVTGTIAARGNNSIGVTGVAYGARVMPLRALAASGGTGYDVNQAVRFAAGLENDSGTVPDAPADIINLSLSGGGFSPSTQALYNDLRARGIIVVAAAGNESSTSASYPASYDNVISVSAVDTQQRITNYSNSGSSIDVAAPGGDGSQDVNGDGYPDGVLSTGASDGEFAYTFLSGTSMASPHVAGVMALMKSVNGNLSADDVDRLLERGDLTDDIGLEGRDNLYGHGVINARKAIEAALTEAGDSSGVEPRLGASSSALNFSSGRNRLELVLRNSGGGELQNVQLQANDSWITVSATDVDEQGLGRYAIDVARDGLAPGVYEGSLTASSSANTLSIRILLSVTDSSDAELGVVYLLLFDPATDSVVAQTVIEAGSPVFDFAFPDSPAGMYQLFAGTDLDNDLVICDGGEACGAYLTIDQPLTINFDRNRDDINFAIEYLVALPGAPSATAQSSGTIGPFPLLRREARSP
ncbi:S8 family peptidase [Congregibacter litoralis]|uniref:Subtilisin-like serine protease n=1 Tax=Congregibacter litoralis KT71 TaxID=314285 RepID=A4AC59_9GAMM|nr:S8 family peptidase [Congregibacter litoralis]EAQ96509.1 Subtilisin-like serine protease [Congregibacter litoralis KT71]